MWRDIHKNERTEHDSWMRFYSTNGGSIKFLVKIKTSLISYFRPSTIITRTDRGSDLLHSIFDATFLSRLRSSPARPCLLSLSTSIHSTVIPTFGPHFTLLLPLVSSPLLNNNYYILIVYLQQNNKNIAPTPAGGLLLLRHTRDVAIQDFGFLKRFYCCSFGLWEQLHS